MPPSPLNNREPSPLAHSSEAAFLVLALGIIAIAAAALTGIGIAAGLCGGGWVWPDSIAHAAQALAGLATGHPEQGYRAALQEKLPSTGILYVAVVLAESVAVGVAVAATTLLARSRDTHRGMASRRQAEHALGRRRLADAGPIIRPDLHADSPAGRNS